MREHFGTEYATFPISRSNLPLRVADRTEASADALLSSSRLPSASAHPMKSTTVTRSQNRRQRLDVDFFGQCVKWPLSLTIGSATHERREDHRRIDWRRFALQFAERYSEIAETKTQNAHNERPATMSLVGDVDGLNVLDAGCELGSAASILTRGGATVQAFIVTPQMVEPPPPDVPAFRSSR